jgi:hypothetical protein
LAGHVVWTFDKGIPKGIVERSLGRRWPTGKARRRWEDRSAEGCLKITQLEKQACSSAKHGVAGGRKQWKTLSANGTKYHRKKKIEITILVPYVNPLSLWNQLIDSFTELCKNFIVHQTNGS